MAKYFNLRTKRTEDLFDTLEPVYTVAYENPLIGYKGECVYLTLVAENEEAAISKAMNNEEFMGYINMDHFNKKYMSAYKPNSLYVIGEVRYYEGDPRL